MMLESLSIRNVVLAKAVEAEFAKGFCVLTGETGAGKSILLDALGLALGARADAKLVRHGEAQASVTAVFSPDVNKEVRAQLDEQGIDIAESLIIRRVLSSDGRSKAYINDSPVSVQLLQKIGESLVEIHGQHDQHGLLSPANHRAILDDFAGHDKAAAHLANLFGLWRAASEKLERSREELRKAQADEDYLTHVLKELDEMSPKVGEEATLDEQRRLMMNREKIVGSLTSAMGELETQPKSAAEALRAASRILERAPEAAQESFAAAIAALDRASNELNEATAAMEQIGRDMDMDAGELDVLEERLFGLRTLARKFNITCDELPKYRDDIAEKLKLATHAEDHIKALAASAEAAKAEYVKEAEVLRDKRQKAAKKIEKAILTELAPLKMESAKVQVEFTAFAESEWNASGMDRIQFLVQTNPGSPFGALSKIASGGELSRFMLALKVVLSGTRSAPTLIFDEIDTGIGGAVADAVGRRLALLGKTHQVLAVTHQPQVAAQGSYHLKIEKSTKGGETVTALHALTDKARQEELARMLAGSQITEEARAAAGKLMGVN